jgi:PPM family protein phosphatase
MSSQRSFEDRFISVAVQTDTGAVRAINEDDVTLLRCGDLGEPWANGCLVADGVGGAGAGEVASRLVTDTMLARFSRWKISRQPPQDWDRGFDTAIREFIEHTHRVIREKASDDPGLSEMKSTAMMAIVVRDHAVLAHVGDCRAYLLRNGRLTLLTVDHTVGEQARRSGARPPANAGALTQALGGRSEVDPDVLFMKVAKGDRLVICTDGLTKELDESEIAALMRTGKHANDIVEQLMRAALGKGARDNVSVGAIIVDRASADRMPPLLERRDAADGARPVKSGGAARTGPGTRPRRRALPVVLGLFASAIIVGGSVVLLQAIDEPRRDASLAGVDGDSVSNLTVVADGSAGGTRNTEPRNHESGSGATRTEKAGADLISPPSKTLPPPTARSGQSVPQVSPSQTATTTPSMAGAQQRADTAVPGTKPPSTVTTVAVAPLRAPQPGGSPAPQDSTRQRAESERRNLVSRNVRIRADIANLRGQIATGDVEDRRDPTRKWKQERDRLTNRIRELEGEEKINLEKIEALERVIKS